MYYEAQKFRETASMNGRLYEPKTQSSNDKVYAASKVAFEGSKHSNNGPYWIGIKKFLPHQLPQFIKKYQGRNIPEVLWLYTSSKTELAFENWFPGRPKNDKNKIDKKTKLLEEGVMMDKWGNGQWFDRYTRLARFFICEFV